MLKSGSIQSTAAMPGRHKAQRVIRFSDQLSHDSGAIAFSPLAVPCPGRTILAHSPASAGDRIDFLLRILIFMLLINKKLNRLI